MRYIQGLGAALLALLFSSPAFAAGLWVGTGNCSGASGDPAYIGATFNTIQAAADDRCAFFTSTQGRTDCTVTSFQFVNTGTNGDNYLINLAVPHPNNAGLTSQCPVQWRTNGTVDCPAGFVEGTDGNGLPACVESGPSCDGTVTGKAIIRPASSAQSALPICGDVSNCQFNPVNVIDLGGGQVMVEYEGTASDCGGSDPSGNETQGQASACISAGGNTFCTEPNLADQNCGYYNDDYLCLDAVPPGDCIFFGNGDMACSTSATSPPAPDDGVTPGTVATPDSTINLNGNTTNIYNSGTVQGGTGTSTGSEQDTPPEQLELDFSEIIEAEPPAGSFVGDIDQSTTDTGAELDTQIDALTDPNDFGVTTSIGDEYSNIFGVSYSCSDIVLDAFGNSVTLECAALADMRAILGWIARVIFFLGVFDLIMRRPE